jgi:hypothetical protein
VPIEQTFDQDVGVVLALCHVQFVCSALTFPSVALAAGHADHPSAADMVVQAALVVFMAALLINVIVSVVAILGEREMPDPADGRTRRFAGEREQHPSQAPEPQGKTVEAKVE